MGATHLASSTAPMAGHWCDDACNITNKQQTDKQNKEKKKTTK